MQLEPQPRPPSAGPSSFAWEGDATLHSYVRPLSSLVVQLAKLTHLCRYCYDYMRASLYRTHVCFLD